MQFIGFKRLLWLRISFVLIWIGHISMKLFQLFENDFLLFQFAVSSNFACVITLPFHTLIVSTMKCPDGLYFLHLYGQGASFLLYALQKAKLNDIPRSLSFGLLAIVYYIYQPPTHLLYVKTFRKATEICWMGKTGLRKIDPEILFKRFTKPWLMLVFLRVAMIIATFLTAYGANRANWRWDLESGFGLCLTFSFFTVQLTFEMYVYLQLQANKTHWKYIFTSNNRFEQLYLCFIVLSICLALGSLVIAFNQNEKVAAAFEYFAMSMRLIRMVVSYFYGKFVMDASRLSAQFATSDQESGGKPAREAGESSPVSSGDEGGGVLVTVLNPLENAELSESDDGEPTIILNPVV